MRQEEFVLTDSDGSESPDYLVLQQIPGEEHRFYAWKYATIEDVEEAWPDQLLIDDNDIETFDVNGKVFFAKQLNHWVD